jgi:hypothetical protein
LGGLANLDTVTEEPIVTGDLGTFVDFLVAIIVFAVAHFAR